MLSDIDVKGSDYKIGGDQVDGQWVNSGKVVFNGVVFSNTGDIEYTVSDYLPDDDHIYEVSMGCYAYTGQTSGDAINWWVRDGSGNYGQTMGYCRTRSGSSTQNGGSGVIPMRQVNGVLTFSVNVINTGSTGGNALYLQGYRRIGGALPPIVNKTLTINPTPADATVTFNKGTVVGNTCTVAEGSRVTVTVSKAGYQSVTKSYIVSDDTVDNITLIEGVPLYGYRYTSGGNTAYLFMIGGMTTDYYLTYNGTGTSPIYTITSITGTIGASGSQVNSYSYSRTIDVNGVTLYCYTKTTLGIVSEISVLPGAVVGDKCFGGAQYVKPTSASSSQVNYSGYIYSRYSSIDVLFTGE